jgi:DNA-binding transcriptional ArsR family regulator
MVDKVEYFYNNGNMEILNAAHLLAALGHESRLAIYRCLVVAGGEGISAGVLGEQLHMPPATLSFHLNHLQNVGLIHARRAGRFIFYSADYASMDALLAFLTSHCCQGKPCFPNTVLSLTPHSLENP